MADYFLHGVEVIDIDAGPRPIQTVRSSVIGIVGTAPNSQAVATAALNTGVVASNNALTWTSKLVGALGNQIQIKLVNPGVASAALSVVADLVNKYIQVNLATDVSKAITTTAAQIIAAITADANANQLVTVANTSTSTGAAAVAAVPRTALAGGIDEAFPLNTPTLIAGSRTEAAKLGLTGTLPDAIDSILDQAGAAIVVVRVAVGATDADTLANVIGGVDAVTGKYLGVHAFKGAESSLGVKPRILVAPGFTHTRTGGVANPVVAELLGIADSLRAVIIADGPNTTDSDAITYAGDFGSKRVYLVDPESLKTNNLGETVAAFSSAHVAGLIAKTDNNLGFWWSPSNNEINGIIGTSRSIDFTLGDPNSRANILNENKVATIIRQNGYRLWGNRTLSDDPKWMFLSVVRTADMIDDSLLAAHLWAVDRNITKTYIQDVVDSVNAYLRHLTAIGAILGGSCWADPALNTPDQIAQGKVYFSFDFTPPYPAEHITFQSHLVQDYIATIFK